jgi:integrase
MAKTKQDKTLASMGRIRRVTGRPGDYYPVLCLDEDGRPVPAPAEWYRLRAERKEPRSTSDTYLAHILVVLTAFREQGVRWNDEPKVVRTAFVRFLRQKLHLRVGRDTLDGHRYALTAQTPVSPSTVNVLRAALRDFYAVLGEEEVGLYRHANPFDSQLLLDLNRVRAEARARGDIPLPEAAEGAATRQPSAFVRAKKGQPWQLDHRLATPAVLNGIFAVVEAMVADPDVAARDKAILLLLRYTGPRAFEAITMTAGGYRARGISGLIRVTNKGAHGRLVKTLAFAAQPRVQEQLDRYLAEERPRWTKAPGVPLAAVPDTAPFFVTARGQPYNYDAFYYHWRRRYRACRDLCPLPIGPHDIRHAMVTDYLLRLRDEQRIKGHDDAWRLEQKTVFGRDIMGWSSAQPIETYDHAIEEAEAWGLLAAQQRGDPIGSVAQPGLSDTTANGASAEVPLPGASPTTVSGYDSDVLARIVRYQGGQVEGGGR